MLNIESENGTPLDNQIEKADHQDKTADENVEPFDYTHVHAVARIALYDDLRSAPRVTEIHPAPTAEFIESLASKIYEQAKNAGGTIPYTVIREVSENFIHARFAEATVSILDEGNTIRFADQGPGIPYKDQAQIDRRPRCSTPARRSSFRTRNDCWWPSGCPISTTPPRRWASLPSPHARAASHRA